MKNLEVEANLVYNDEFGKELFNEQFEKIGTNKFIFTDFGRLTPYLIDSKDYAEIKCKNYVVYVNKRELERVTMLEFDDIPLKDYQEYFTDVLFKSPITGEFNIKFDYLNIKGETKSFDLTNHHKGIGMDISRFLYSRYSLKVNYTYLFYVINSCLVDYQLSENDKEEIKKAMLKIKVK